MTAILDLAAISAAFYARLKSDAAGSDVRALLGGATSIIPAQALRGTLPPCPFIAWREGPVTGKADDWRGVVAAWWTYDDPIQGWRRINTIIAAIEAAYPIDWYPYGESRPGPVGQGVEDSALGALLTRQITITYSRRA